jgi:uncharacterized protein (TIGR00297 family)
MNNQPLMTQFAIGTILAIIISISAWRLHMLSLSGMIAAGVMGMLVFGLGGLPWACLLIVFFISSSLLSRFARKRKYHLDEKFSKGTRRDAWQVVANGGVATLLLVITWIQREMIGCSDTCFAANGWAFLTFAGSLAAANADTWATELGVLSKTKPHLITNGRQVSAGTSGAISLAGILAATTGAGVIAILAAISWTEIPHPLDWRVVLLLVTVAGLAGSLVDSLLGATFQSIYYCPVCEKETERYPKHKCGSDTIKLRGLEGVDNDMVNLACTLGGALLIWLVFMLLS